LSSSSISGFWPGWVSILFTGGHDVVADTECPEVAGALAADGLDDSFEVVLAIH
jgi:hypothetical protein